MKDFKNNIENNDYKVCFFALDTKGHYHELMEYVYDLALMYEQLGIETYVIHEEKEYKKPEWLSEQHANLTHYSIEEFSSKVASSPSDFVFVPELYGEVISQLVENKVPSEIVLIVQEFNSVFDVLEIGQSYSINFGVKNVIVPSTSTKNMLNQYIHGVNYHVINPYVKECFQKTGEPKKPIVLMSGNKNEVQRIIKKFYLKYPQYAWLPFKLLDRFHINEIAQQYQQSPCIVHMDDMTPFGIEHLQAMSKGCVPIGITPKLAPDWLLQDGKIKNVGVYTNNVLKIPDLVAHFMDQFLTDRLDESIISNALKCSHPYTRGNTLKQFNITVEKLKQSRLQLFEKIEEKNKEKEQTV